MKHKPYGPYERFVKRTLDCVLATGASVVLAPFIGVIALAVRKNLGTPILFTQERPGMDEVIFKLYKFRTMTNDRDEDGELLPDELRLTDFGKFLRSTSLDELPELINIIKGDMAIVGPRPLLVKYLTRYDDFQKKRHDVRPGLTGLAQVHGRNAVDWEDKFSWDVLYTENITFLGDLKIVMETIGTVLKREGISSDTSATMEEFLGKAE